MRCGILCQELANGLIADLSDLRFPSIVSGISHSHCHFPDGVTLFGYVYEGAARISFAAGSFPVPRGFSFCAPGPLELSCDGRALVAARIGYRGVFSLSGPLEPQGRLRYINGCSDSVLIAPTRRGDPCLNMLYVPPGIDQTEHTHPTVRAGIVVSGSGICRTPECEFPLPQGGVFVLAPDAPHSFHTTGEHMQIVVFHPDSDTGPSDDDHPMLNRTLVNGRAASTLEAIRTLSI
jgi:hypothetical protein